MVQRILADKPHPEMGYCSCLGLIRLAGKYSPSRMEAACERALLSGAIGYQRVKINFRKVAGRATAFSPAGDAAFPSA
jgi:hypothetical protein